MSLIDRPPLGAFRGLPSADLTPEQLREREEAPGPLAFAASTTIRPRFSARTGRPIWANWTTDELHHHLMKLAEGSAAVYDIATELNSRHHAANPRPAA